ncbi:YHS domain-containing (seleno)protein [Ekhidna sp.]
MRKFAFFAIPTLFLLGACSSESPEEKDPVFNEEGIALAGYDPVAYFEQSEAKKGTDQEVVNYEGLKYYFSSTKNKLLFEENPEKYLPEYGGWCAFAIAESSTKMEPDPTMWQIQDGKLQLFYDDWMTNLTGNLKEAWNEDSIASKIKADENWQKFGN